MLREQNKLIAQFHRALDICLTVAAFIAAYFIKRYLLPVPFRGLTTGPNYYVILLMAIIIWYVVFGLFDLYASYRKETFGSIFWNMVKAVLVGMLILTLGLYLFKITDVGRIMLDIFFLLNVGFLGIKVLGIIDQLKENLRERVVDEVIFALPRHGALPISGLSSFG